MRIFVNGKEQTFAKGITVSGLLELLNIKLHGIAVELNLEIVPKSRYAETVLRDSDKIEIVQMVGGG
ncbi:MAG: sulfur carrier protein ThiS [Deltaproteobacteria bacterium]|nr:sulfur carrier protein ThiS [Deltaproteobacteria bacterium]